MKRNITKLKDIIKKELSLLEQRGMGPGTARKPEGSTHCLRNVKVDHDSNTGSAWACGGCPCGGRCDCYGGVGMEILNKADKSGMSESKLPKWVQEANKIMCAETPVPNAIERAKEIYEHYTGNTAGYGLTDSSSENKDAWLFERDSFSGDSKKPDGGICVESATGVGTVTGRGPINFTTCGNCPCGGDCACVGKV